jgi:hypothetical protein
MCFSDERTAREKVRNMYRWLFDYCLTEKEFEVRLFRSLLIYRLKKQNIVSAHVIEGIFPGWKFGSYPWNTILMGNRMSWRRVLLEKRWWPWFLEITPADPDAFVHSLDLPKRR